ncbi:YodC family protein [Vreelandella sp. GE22]
MDDKFVVGDIVKLKSGGPEMTVNAPIANPRGYRCQWFAGKKLEQGIFPGDSLEKVEKSTS